ncbi:MAG: hypothetical protein AAF657_18715 [Acidobacteriota bacterium]
MNRHLCILALALVVLSEAPALADDLRPPTYRFDPFSTVAGWDFLTEQVDLIRPDANVPLWSGDAADLLQEKFEASAPYPTAARFGDVSYTHNLGGGYTGGSAGDGGLVFVVPNYLQSLPYKRLRLQVTYQGPEPPTTVVGYAGIPGSQVDIKQASIERTPVNDPSLAPANSFFYEDWLIFPSPTWEQVVVFLPAETILLGVVIDTVIESPPPIFEDGFEPADVEPWR